jgi:hypothetical protein
MKEQVKVLFIGPKDSGKTALANYIADAVQVLHSTQVNISMKVFKIPVSVKKKLDPNEKKG